VISEPVPRSGGSSPARAIDVSVGGAVMFAVVPTVFAGSE
jgi:hypothetical protein